MIMKVAAVTMSNHLDQSNFNKTVSSTRVTIRKLMYSKLK